MGTTYDLIKVDKGETYDLGKIVGTIFSTEKPFLLPFVFEDKDKLRSAISELMEHGWSFDSEEDKTSYLDWMVDGIWDWCGYDRVICSSDLNYQENVEHYVAKYGGLVLDYDSFKETGTRYREAT